MMIETRPDRALVRAHGKSVRYLLVRIVAPAAPRREDRPPVNMSFVLDRSGSMSGQKIELARQAVLAAVNSLDPDDRFSVVVYDHEVEIVVPSTPATPAARKQAAALLARIGARGTTALFDGWVAGCEQIAQHLNGDPVARCLLLTDGLANVGLTDSSAIAAEAGQLAARGVSTSTFGIGRDYDELLLEQMADRGHGTFYYIATAAQIPDFIASEVGEALEVVARDVTIELQVPAGVRVTSLNDAPSEWRRLRDDGTDAGPSAPSHERALGAVSEGRFTVGSLVSDQLYEAVFELRFPPGEVGAEQSIGISVVDPAGVLKAAAAEDHDRAATETEVTFTYASHPDNDRQLRDTDIDRLVAELYAARAQREGLKLQRRDDYEGSRRVLQKTAAKMREYAGDDEQILALSVELEAKADAYATSLPAALMKAEHAQQRNRRWRRDEKGRATRRADVRERTGKP